MKHNVLHIKNVSKHFDGVKAVDGFSLEINQGEIICITGGNGAGKTTLFNLITGFEKVDTGTIIFKEQDIRVVLDGIKKGQLTSCTVTLLHSSDLDAENTLTNPNTVLPQKEDIQIDGNVLNVKLGAKTFAVYKFVKK